LRLQTLVLHDFGAYRGRQEIDFSTEPGKPVVLVGALNGAGKTTLLDAFKLVLYGKRARCSNRGSLAYEEYLRACINRRVRAHDGAGLELTFAYWREGQQHTVHLHRSWRQVGETVREVLDVIHDGQRDRVLSEQWNEQVEEFLPQGLSDLFLFDGEKIEQLAEPASSQELLRTAISGLLGLDLVDQLATDLLVVEKKLADKLGTQVDQKRSTELEEATLSRQDAFTRAEEALAEARARFHTLQSDLVEVEELITRHGGTLYEQRPLIEQARRDLEREVHHLDEQFRELAGGSLPLALVLGQVQEVAAQAELEMRATTASALIAELESRDKALLLLLRQQEGPPGLTTTVEKHLKSDRKKRATDMKVDVYLGADSELLNELRGLIGGVLENAVTRSKMVVSQREARGTELEQLERKLVGIPDSEDVRNLMVRRSVLREKIAGATAALHAREAELADRKRELEFHTKKATKAREDLVERQTAALEAGRVVQHAQRSRRSLEAFRKAVLSHHVQRLSELIQQTFRALMRKSSLVHSLEILTDTCELRIHAADGHLLSAQRLSAGERQLLAVAILWGLAKASGRPLPTIIDTPMARLDSKHREKLVEHYFPFASHQVLILSTDEEIDSFWYGRLKPYISRAYTLENDDLDQRTVVVPGYLPEETLAP
jgi:DNA sulfur modification protein DndD